MHGKTKQSIETLEQEIKSIGIVLKIEKSKFHFFINNRVYDKIPNSNIFFIIAAFILIILILMYC